MGDKPADEPSSEDVVNEYLRRFDKRVEKKKSTNFLVNTFIVLLFGIAVAVVGAGTYLRSSPLGGAKDRTYSKICGI